MFKSARKTEITRLLTELPAQARRDVQSDLKIKPWGYYSKTLLAALRLTVRVAQRTGLDGEALYEAFDATYSHADLLDAIDAAA